MPQAKQGDTVKVDYTGKLDDGTIFDSSHGGTPLEFTIGDGQVIPDFEKAVVGMEPGDSKTITTPADRAYGPHDENMVVQVDREMVPPGLDLQVGMQLEMSQANGMVIPVTVTNVSDNNVTLDANHPLAGEDLTFDIELVQIG